MCGCLCPPNASRSFCTQAAPQTAHEARGAAPGGVHQGRRCFHGQGGRQRHNGQRSFFFAERSTTLERSVRSVTSRPAVSGLAGILSLNKCVMHGELTGTMRNACHDGACCGDVYVNLNNDLRVRRTCVLGAVSLQWYTRCWRHHLIRYPPSNLQVPAELPRLARQGAGYAG